MTITQMQYFVAVCEYGTISKSAEILHISQPSISLAIKDLEEQFGVTLFERENKRLVLSEEGKYMYSVTKGILKQINSLEVQISDLGKHRNQICISVPILAGSFLLRFFMKDFHRQYPDFRFITRQFITPKALKALDEGSCDMAIMVDEEKLPKSLEKRPIYCSEFVFCVNPDHPLAHESSLDLTDLVNEPVILSQENSYMTKILKSEFYKTNAVPNILMYGVQLSLIRDMVSSGQASTFLIKELADSCPDMVSIPLTQKIPITFSLVWRKDKFLNKKTQTLIEHILSSFDYDEASVCS